MSWIISHAISAVKSETPQCQCEHPRHPSFRKQWQANPLSQDITIAIAVPKCVSL